MNEEVLAGRYRIEQELGRGGMATVYRARDERLGRQVAVKVMHPSLPESARRRFRQEAEIVASLKHRNILEIHDVGEEGAGWLVTEWVEGESLRGWISREGPISGAAASVIAWELSLALAEAHKRGVVHRDVKPENVLIARDGRLKLADFGIAAVHDQERLTSTGAVTGSLAYMAPERLDDGRFSPASDVYAVGVIIFELCTGGTPFHGKGAAHLAAAVLTKDAPGLEEFAPAASEALCALVARCLARDPRGRFQDGAELAAALEALIRAELGSPSDASRALLTQPSVELQRLRQRDYEVLLARARALLSRGQAARAGKLLDAALAIRPGSEEVRALLFGSKRTRRRWLLAVGGVAFALAVIGVAIHSFWSGRPAPPQPQVSREVAVDPQPPAVQPAAPTDAPTTPARSEPVEKAVAAAAPAHPKKAVIAAKAEARPTPPAPASLEISTRPWAEVFIDGKSLGYTPSVRTIPLTPGEHELRLVSPHAEPWEEKLTAHPTEVIKRDVVLTLRKASLRIHAPDGSAVFVDGVQVGVAPLPAPIEREHGRRTVSAILPDGRRVSREVNLVAGRLDDVTLEGGP